MRPARRSFLAWTMASLAAPAVCRLARADAPQFRFKLHHSDSSVSSAHNQFLVPWAHQVESQSNGRIHIDIFPAMELGGAPAQLFEQARNGIADLVWAAPRQTPGHFPKIEVFELPFVPSRRALVSSKAIEDYARVNLVDEFAAIHAICFSCSDRGVLHSHRLIPTIEEIRGLRLHVQTRMAAAAVRALGAFPVPMPSAQLPLAVARHVVDGCLDPWDMVPALRLSDLLKAHTEFSESSLSSTTFVLAMNKAAYNRLPRDLKTVIDQNSGQVAAGMAGAMWDLKAAAVIDIVGQRGDPIVTLLPEAVAHWRKATESVIDGWLQQMAENKVDGGKLLASARALLLKYADESEPQPPQPPRPMDSPAAQSPTSAPAAPVANAAAAPSPHASAAMPTPPKVPALPSPMAKPVPTPKSLKIPL